MNIKEAWNTLWNKKALTSMSRAMVINGQLVWIGDNAQSYIKDGYCSNDIIYSIINLIVDKVKVAPWGLYKITDESSLKQMNALQMKSRNKDLRKIRDLQAKALKPFEGGHKIKDLIEFPNPDEAFCDIVGAHSGYKLLSGNSFIWGNLLDMGSNKGKPGELHTMPAQFTNVIAQRGWPVRKTGYMLNSGQVVEFTLQEVMHDKYWNPEWDFNGGHLVGMSPLRAGSKKLTRNNSSLKASTKAFQNNGMEGVLFIDDDRLSGDNSVAQAGALKQKLVQEYSGEDNFKKIAVSGYKTGWQQMGLSPVDLNILESEKWDLRSLCALYGVSSELLNDPDNKTHANREEAEMALTSRAALPLLTSFRNSLNRKFQTDWGYKGAGLVVDFDMGVYTELQEDMKTLTDWLQAAWWLSLKQKYEIMNMEIPDYIDQSELEKIYIPSNLTELGMQDLQNQLNEVDGSQNVGGANGRNNSSDSAKR